MIRRRTLLTLAGLAPLAWAVRAWAADTISIGVAPQFEQRRLFAIWKPVADELRRLTGLDIRLVSTLTAPEFEAELGRGTFDVAFTSAFATQRFGYRPLVSDTAALRGILVVRRDSALKSPHDLAGRTVSMPSVNAYGPAVVCADLANLFHLVPRVVNVRTHSGVFSAVIGGQADAGAAVESTLLVQDQSVRDQLRVLYATRDLPGHVFSTHPRLADGVRQQLLRAFLGLGAGPEGQRMLSQVPLAGLQPAQDSDYPPRDGWGVEWQSARE